MFVGLFISCQHILESPGLPAETSTPGSVVQPFSVALAGALTPTNIFQTSLSTESAVPRSSAPQVHMRMGTGWTPSSTQSVVPRASAPQVHMRIGTGRTPPSNTGRVIMRMG